MNNNILEFDESLDEFITKYAKEHPDLKMNEMAYVFLKCLSEWNELEIEIKNNN